MLIFSPVGKVFPASPADEVKDGSIEPGYEDDIKQADAWDNLKTLAVPSSQQGTKRREAKRMGPRS